MCCNIVDWRSLRKKSCPPSAQMVFIGVLFNSISLILSITQERLNEIRILISEWIQKREAMLRELQSLIGKLNFVAHCGKPARIFISRLLNWLRKIGNTDSPKIIPAETKKNMRWWFQFLPKYNGVLMMDLGDWSKPDPLGPHGRMFGRSWCYFCWELFSLRFPRFHLRATAPHQKP